MLLLNLLRTLFRLLLLWERLRASLIMQNILIRLIRLIMAHIWMAHLNCMHLNGIHLNGSHSKDAFAFESRVFHLIVSLASERRAVAFGSRIQKFQFGNIKCFPRTNLSRDSSKKGISFTRFLLVSEYATVGFWRREKRLAAQASLTNWSHWNLF